MKRSRLFLGTTISCLILAGIFAAKANYLGGKMAYYYTSDKPERGHCKLWGKCPCVDDPTGEYVCTDTDKKGRTFPLYSDSSCTKKLRYTIR